MTLNWRLKHNVDLDVLYGLYESSSLNGLTTGGYLSTLNHTVNWHPLKWHLAQIHWCFLTMYLRLNDSRFLSTTIWSWPWNDHNGVNSNILTQCGLVTQYVATNFCQHLAPSHCPEPLLIWSSIWLPQRACSLQILKISITGICLKITHMKLQPYFQKSISQLTVMKLCQYDLIIFIPQTEWQAVINDISYPHQ